MTNMISNGFDELLCHRPHIITCLLTAVIYRNHCTTVSSLYLPWIRLIKYSRWDIPTRVPVDVQHHVPGVDTTITRTDGEATDFPFFKVWNHSYFVRRAVHFSWQPSEIVQYFVQLVTTSVNIACTKRRLAPLTHMITAKACPICNNTLS